MPVPGVRTLVVSVLAAAVAVRMTATQPLTGAYARIAADPAGALRGAADGWTVSGTLGDATAQGLRDVPVAAFLWLTDVLGVPSVGGRTVWSVLVLVLAAVGAVRLARAGVAAVDTPHEPWTPWVGAALFACAPVLVTTVQHAPGDGLVVALLPWVLAPTRAPGGRLACSGRVRCLARPGRCGYAAVGPRRAGRRPRDGRRDLPTSGRDATARPVVGAGRALVGLVGGRLRVGGVVRHRPDGTGGHRTLRQRDRRHARAPDDRPGPDRAAAPRAGRRRGVRPGPAGGS